MIDAPATCSLVGVGVGVGVATSFRWRRVAGAGLRWRVGSEVLVGLLLLLPENRRTHFPRPVLSMMQVPQFLLLFLYYSSSSSFLIAFLLFKFNCLTGDRISSLYEICSLF